MHSSPKNELGFDACVDHRAGELDAALDAPLSRRPSTSISRTWVVRCQRAVFPRLRDFGPHGDVRHGRRIQRPPSPAPGPNLDGARSASGCESKASLSLINGTVSTNGLAIAAPWIKDGPAEISRGHRGWESRTAPEAFVGLLAGRNFGKLLIRV